MNTINSGDLFSDYPPPALLLQQFVKTEMSPAALLTVAAEAASAGAKVVRARSADLSTIEWSEKGTADFVTQVDRESEVAIAHLLNKRLPNARVIGEELSPAVDDLAGVTFIVDPIDGTTNFLHGYPEYAVSIGVAVDGEPVAGVVLNVPTGEIFTAAKGHGAQRNGEPMRVSSTEAPRRALVGTGFPFKHRHHTDAYLRQMTGVITATAGIRRAGSAALDLADVACGRFDCFWELRLAPWDIAAGIVLVREAGGIVSDLAGNAAAIAHSPIVAGNPAMHRWLLDTLTNITSEAEMRAINGENT